MLDGLECTGLPRKDESSETTVRNLLSYYIKAFLHLKTSFYLSPITKLNCKPLKEDRR